MRGCPGWTARGGRPPPAPSPLSATMTSSSPTTRHHTSRPGARRGRVTHRTPPDRLVVIDPPGLTQRGGVRLGGQHVQPAPFLGQHLCWRPTGLAMRAGVDLSQNASAAATSSAKLRVVVAQVRARGHQVAFGDLHRRLHAALGLGVIRDAGLDLAAVVPTAGDHRRVTHRDRRRRARRSRSFRCPTTDTSVPRRPGAGWRPDRRPGCPSCGPTSGSPPGTGTTPATRRTDTSCAADPRAVTPVELAPHPRLGHPRPIAAPMPARHAAFTSATARRVVRSSPPNPIATSRSCTTSARTSALRAVDQLLHLLQERIDQPKPPDPRERVAARVADRHVTGHRLRVDARQLAAEWAQRVRSNASRSP